MKAAHKPKSQMH